MNSLEAVKRMALWAIELSKFDVQYCPCIAVKGQMVAEFITEFTHMEGQGWKSLLNGASTRMDPSTNTLVEPV